LAEVKVPDSIHSNAQILLVDCEVARALEYLESGLRSIQETTYHKVIGRTMLGQDRDRDAAYTLAILGEEMSKEIDLAAMYVEMNAFADNTDQWYFSGFGYNKHQEGWNKEWLAHWDSHPEMAFPITGWEDIQEVFAEHFCDTELPLQMQLARDIAEHLVFVRYIELILAAAEQARKWRKLRVPLYAGAHGFGIEVAVKSKRRRAKSSN
jgi:hypothetical protein